MEVYVGLLGALLGSALTGVVAIVLDRQRGKRDQLEARDQRRYDRDERRYQDRFDAYAAFEAAVQQEFRSVADFVDEHGVTPADVGFDPREIKPLTDALARVQLLASSGAEKAATELSAAVHEYVYGSATASEISALRRAFRDAARADLAGRLE